MARRDSDNQKRSMSAMFRGRAIFKPLNTGRIDDRVACVREWVANIFFYTKNGTTIMIDAGYNYARLREKMGWLDIDPASIRHILITHQDTDHVGALEPDSERLFKDAVVHIGEIENRYLTGEKRRRVIHGLYKLPMVKMENKKVLLKDGDVFTIDGIKVECLLVPGHTWGHMVYLIDDEYLFTGDTIWFGVDGGYSFISTLAEDNKLSLVRTGKYPSTMVFEKDGRHMTMYRTDYGTMTIVISTRSISSTLGDSGGVVDVLYDMEIENQPAYQHHLVVSVTEKEQRRMSV